MTGLARAATGRAAAIMAFGVARADVGVPVAAGPHLRLGFGPFLALAGPVTLAAAAETLEDETAAAQAQNAVLSAYAAEADVVPVRFGCIAASSEALLSRLQAQSAALQGQLAAVSGSVEFAVHIQSTGAPTARPRVETGLGYLQAQRAARDGRTAAADTQRAFLGAFCEALEGIGRLYPALSQPADRLASFALVLPREALRDLDAFAAAWADPARAAGCAVAVRGPWPPFSLLASEEATG